MTSRDHDTWRGRPVTRAARWSRYLPFITACIAIGTSLAAFLVVGEGNKDLKLLIGFCIALSAIVLSLQIEALVRLAERANAQERYGRLLATIEEYPDLLPIITRAAEASVETLKNSQVEPFREHVLTFLADAQARLQDLAQGRLYTSGGDKTLLLSVFANTSSLVQGTTDARDTAWWQQAIGREFLTLNRDLVHRKSKGNVVRVWILKERPPESTREVIEDHVKAGVTVYIVRANELDDDLLVNMTMMDGRFLHQDITNRLRRAGEYLFSENHEDLERAEARFRRILAVATLYEGPQSLDVLFAVADNGNPRSDSDTAEESSSTQPPGAAD